MMPVDKEILQPSHGPRHGLYIPAGPDTVSWGWVRAGGTPPIATVAPGDLVTVDTISHEGILSDQGRDPVAYFASFGIDADAVLLDAIALAASAVVNDPVLDGPHVVTGPIWVEGAEPGDVVTVEVVDLLRRVPYGVISNRHGRGALPGELPEAGIGDSEPPLVVSRFATVDPVDPVDPAEPATVATVTDATASTPGATASTPGATASTPGATASTPASVDPASTQAINDPVSTASAASTAPAPIGATQVTGVAAGSAAVAARAAAVPGHPGNAASAPAAASTATVHAPGGRGLRLPLRPFLGLVAVAPAGSDAHSVPPGPHGGNLDVRLLGKGSRLHLPVRCEGALVQVGDPHFAQGDGEIALTALEGSLRAVLRIHLTKAACPSWDLPYGETDDAWILLGLHQDLDEAVRIATRAALALVTERTGVDRATAYAWLSAAADLSVSQVVDGVKGVHFAVPKAWLSAI